MAREKGVVVEEIGMNEDTPEDLCTDLLFEAAFGKRNYGRNILGPAKNVAGFTREDIFAYKNERYCPQNIVISFAGNIDIEEAAQLAELYFGAMECKNFKDRQKNILWQSGNLFRPKPIEQAHFAFAFPSVERNHKDYAATQVMNTVLGGGMSSRLFKRVREELGLAYSVGSYSSHYEEVGALIVYAGVNPQKAEEAAAAVKEVIDTFVKEGVSQEEFLRGKEQLRASSIFSQESTSSQMLLYGKYMLFTNEAYDFEKRMAEIAAVTQEDICRVINESFDFSRIAVASVGNLKKAITL